GGGHADGGRGRLAEQRAVGIRPGGTLLTRTGERVPKPAVPPPFGGGGGHFDRCGWADPAHRPHPHPPRRGRGQAGSRGVLLHGGSERGRFQSFGGPADRDRRRAGDPLSAGGLSLLAEVEERSDLYGG